MTLEQLRTKTRFQNLIEKLTIAQECTNQTDSTYEFKLSRIKLMRHGKLERTFNSQKDLADYLGLSIQSTSKYFKYPSQKFIDQGYKIVKVKPPKAVSKLKYILLKDGVEVGKFKSQTKIAQYLNVSNTLVSRCVLGANKTVAGHTIKDNL